jgi:hypothetical protein
MKALTVRQPWAWAILHAGKDIENRTWRTKHRGTLAIHASLSRAGHWTLPDRVIPPTNLERGAILGIVVVVDVVDRSTSDWFLGPFGWALADPYPLSQAVPCRGGLGLWTVPTDIEDLIRRTLRGRISP